MENFETDELSIPFAHCYTCAEYIPVELYTLGDFAEIDLDIHVGGVKVTSEELSKVQLVFCGKCGAWLNRQGNTKINYYGESELRGLGWKLAPKETEQPDQG